jgi:hypothetical protein
LRDTDREEKENVKRGRNGENSRNILHEVCKGGEMQEMRVYKSLK